MSHSMIHGTLPAALALSLLGYASCAVAGEPFTGIWTIDLRTPSERQSGAECGTDNFVLTQTGDAINGSHSMATVSCGRLNEGSPVRGVVVGSTAVLVVTSGRNGAIALGTAELSKGQLRWRQLEELRAGDPESDSPLILSSGSLVRVPQQVACKPRADVRCHDEKIEATPESYSRQ